MALEPLSTAPALADFTLLSSHQQQTPGTFFGGKPVLHLLATAAAIQIPQEHYAAQKDLENLTGSLENTPANDQVTVKDVDVWVTSKHLIFFNPALSSGLRIEYPTITVTAQDGNDLLLELNLSDPDTADDDIEFLQIRITPGRVERHAGESEQAQAGAGSNGTTTHNDASTALFKAISDCQELNPDPPSEGEDEEQAFDETAPGATGWITSENMADFMDEDGNFRMPAGTTVIGGEEETSSEQQAAEEPLGEGAGQRRRAAETVDEDESKWQRTG